MKNRLISCFALISAALIAMPCASFAGKNGRGGQNSSDFRGKVTAVDASAKTITVQQNPKRGGEAKTFTVTDATKITVDGKDGALANITTSMRASVTPGTPETTAATIVATTRQKRRDKSAGATTGTNTVTTTGTR